MLKNYESGGGWRKKTGAQREIMIQALSSALKPEKHNCPQPGIVSGRPGLPAFFPTLLAQIHTQTRSFKFSSLET